MAAEWILPTALVTARAIHFAACIGLAGFWVFDSILPRDADRARWESLLRQATVLFLWLILFSGIAWFFLVARDMGGDWSLETLRTVWTQTLFGKVQWFRLAFLAATAFLVRPHLKAIPLAALLASLAWAGHGSTGPHPQWHLPADVIHLLASGCWPGALLPLALLIRQQQPTPELLRRFSRVSFAAVALMLGTGVINSLCLVDSWAGLIQTAYGIALLVKSGLFLAMIGIGAYNFFRPQHLASSVRRELILAAAIIGVVALMGILPPALSHS